MFARHRTPPWTVYLGSVATWVSGQGVAHAQASPGLESTDSIQLSYDAPEGCGTRAQVLARVQQSVRSLPGPGVSLSAQIAVHPTDGGFTIHYDGFRHGVASKRELVVADCQAAVEASALLLLFTLDPVLDVQMLPEETVASEESAPEVDTDVPDVASPPQAERAGPKPAPAMGPRARDADVPLADRTAPRLEAPMVFLGGDLVTALAPGVARGVRLGLGSAVSGIRGEIAAAYAWVPEQSVPEVNDARLVSHLYRLHLRLSYPLVAGTVRLAPLLGAGVEHLWARVDGITNPVSGASTWLTGVGGAELDVRVWGALSWRLQAGVVVSLQRPRFIVKGLGPVHQPDPLGLEASTGLVWAWEPRSGTR